MSELFELVLRVGIYIQPIQFSLAIIVSVLNIIVLSSRTFHSSPCTYYFKAYAICSILYTSVMCPTHFLRGFHIDLTNIRIVCQNLFLCCLSNSIRS